MHRETTLQRIDLVSGKGLSCVSVFILHAIILIAIVSILFITTGFSQKTFDITGRISSSNATNIRITYFENGKNNNDSSKVVNQEFKFHFINPDVKMVLLSADNLAGYKLLLVDSNTRIIVDTLAIANSKVSNSSTSLEFENVNEFVDSIQHVLAKLVRARNAIDARKDSILYLAASNEFNATANKMWQYKLQFIQTHSSDIISLFYLNDIAFFYRNQVETLFNSIKGSHITNHNLYAFLKDKVMAGKKIKAGNTFPIYEFKNINGYIFKPQSLKSKYLLINVWGSWCRPCVYEIPQLVELYKSYNRDEFDIISIAYEDKSLSIQQLAELANKYNMQWNNVICYKNLKNKNAEIINKLGIDTYPTNILIDPVQNKIIWMAIGNDGISKLSEILRKK